MKRIICIICLLTCLLTACTGRSKPADMSQECFDLGCKAMDAADDFIDGEMSAIVAAGVVQEQCQKLGELPTDQADGVQAVLRCCEQMSYMLVRAANGDHYAASELITARNDLARAIGQSTR